MPVDRVPVRVPGYSLERLDDELLLYHAGSTRTIYLNATASLIWQLCDGQRSVDAIVRLLCEAYPDERRAIAGDVHTAVARLAAEGAIELA